MKIFCLLIGMFSINAAFAGLSDTCRDDKKELNCIAEINCANIVFPSVLCGTEEMAIDYVARFSNARRQYLINMFNKSRKYYPKVAALLKKEGVPQEFWVLMALESAFNANAVSKAGAVGFWQFMDPVAKEYGLKIAENEKAAPVKSKKSSRKQIVSIAKKKATDERTHFIKSTVAAARYLKDRGRNLNNNWLLIAASYNWGVGNVWNAMQRTGKENPTFWDIKKYLPQETLSYVMNFITLNVIYNNYDQFLKGTLVFYDTPVESDEKDEPSMAGL